MPSTLFGTGSDSGTSDSTPHGVMKRAIMHVTYSVVILSYIFKIISLLAYLYDVFFLFLSFLCMSPLSLSLSLSLSLTLSPALQTQYYIFKNFFMRHCPPPNPLKFILLILQWSKTHWLNIGEYNVVLSGAQLMVGSFSQHWVLLSPRKHWSKEREAINQSKPPTRNMFGARFKCFTFFLFWQKKEKKWRTGQAFLLLSK